MTDLGTLVPGPATTTVSVAFGINNCGTVVGFSQVGGLSSPSHAVVWRDGVIIDVNAAGWQTPIGYAINDAGQIAGLGSNPVFAGGHGLLLTPDSAPQSTKMLCNGVLPQRQFQSSR
jgi:probable HAF family extracellular repeat protein